MEGRRIMDLEADFILTKFDPNGDEEPFIIPRMDSSEIIFGTKKYKVLIFCSRFNEFLCL